MNIVEVVSSIMMSDSRDPRYLTSIIPRGVDREGDGNQEIDNGPTSLDFQQSYVWAHLRNHGVGDGFSLLNEETQREDWFKGDYPKWNATREDEKKWEFKDQFRPNFIFARHVEGQPREYVIWIVKKAWLYENGYGYCIDNRDTIQATEQVIERQSTYIVAQARNLNAIHRLSLIHI